MKEKKIVPAALMRQLKPGECAAFADRIPIEEVSSEELHKRLAKRRTRLNTTLNRVKEDTGRNYRLESGIYINHDHTAVILNCVVSCTEMEDDYI
jgi:hypothetical protein